MHRHNHIFYGHWLTPFYLQVVFMRWLVKASVLLLIFWFVIDTADISEVCAAQFKSWQHRCLTSVGKCPPANLHPLFSDTHMHTYTAPLGHPCDPCCTHPCPPSDYDTLASFSDMIGFQLRKKTSDSDSLHPPSVPGYTTHTCTHISGHRGMRFRLGNYWFVLYIQWMTPKNGPAPTQPASVGLQFPARECPEWGADVLSQRTELAGWEEENRGVLLSPAPLNQRVCSKQLLFPLLSTPLLSSITICSQPPTATLKALIWVTGCRMASRHSVKPTPSKRKLACINRWVRQKKMQK